MNIGARTSMWAENGNGPVENAYLKFTGVSSYCGLDTVAVTDDFSGVVDFKIESQRGSYPYVLGNNRCGLLKNEKSGSQIIFYYNTTEKRLNLGTDYPQTKRFSYTFGKHWIAPNGTSGDFTNTYSGNLYFKFPAATEFYSIYLWGVKFYTGGVLTHDYRPMLSGGSPVLFDIVTGNVKVPTGTCEYGVSET